MRNYCVGYTVNGIHVNSREISSNGSINSGVETGKQTNKQRVFRMKEWQSIKFSYSNTPNTLAFNPFSLHSSLLIATGK
jgi:hypothetical protein